HSDDRRGRRAGPLPAVLERTMGAGRHPWRRRCPAQRCREGGVGRRGGAATIDDDRPGDPGAEGSVAGGARGAAEGGNRQVVARHQGGGHHGALSRYSAALFPHLPPNLSNWRCSARIQRTVPVAERITTVSVSIRSFLMRTPCSIEPLVTPVAENRQSPCT